MIVTKYALEVVIDDQAWEANYGVSGLFAISDDVKQTLASVVAELVDNWIASTGNVGAVRKIAAKK